MVDVPKPKYNPARKSTNSSANYDSGNRRTTDVERSHASNANQRRNEIQQRKDAAKSGRTVDRQTRQTDTGNVVRNRRSEQERRSQQHQRDQSRSGRTIDRQMRQTDTGTKRQTEQRRQNKIKNMNMSEYHARSQKIDRYTDNNTSRNGGRKYYGNADATKRAMKEKYGDRNDNRLTTYDRADYKGKEIERKVKQRWKPSDVSSQRPGESGREWGKHKYIDKVRTKSGKIRYIYSIDGGGSSHEDAGKTMRKNQNSKAASQINYNKAQARKAARSAGNKVKSFLSKLFG